ncbi:MAG: DUF4282 domain-containing protein [Campylobacterota bacterium]|nr:DUF4282 domain-containing protein [Campylobacterota bacterium]
MQELYDILSFKTFISPYMLYIFYYVGAVLVPLVMLKYSYKIYAFLKIDIKKIIPQEYRLKVYAVSILIFLFLEILWRMMFEFLIAYLQIRDALVF